MLYHNLEHPRSTLIIPVDASFFAFLPSNVTLHNHLTFLLPPSPALYLFFLSSPSPPTPLPIVKFKSFDLSFSYLLNWPAGNCCCRRHQETRRLFLEIGLFPLFFFFSLSVFFQTQRQHKQTLVSPYHLWALKQRRQASNIRRENRRPVLWVKPIQRKNKRFQHILTISIAGVQTERNRHRRPKQARTSIVELRRSNLVGETIHCTCRV